MRVSNGAKIFSAVVACCFFTAVIAALFAQNSVPSPTISPSPSPSVSPTPARTPSPTPTPPVAQNFHRWGSITLFNGLPSDSVRAIAQTADGVMWFGTDNGLARFDGRRVQNFSLGNGDENRILSMKVSPSGELWIGSRNGAVVYVDGRFEPVSNSRGVSIGSLLFDFGAIYLGTDRGDVLSVKRSDDGSFVAEKVYVGEIPSKDGIQSAVTSLVPSQAGIIAVTYAGLFVVNDGGYSELRWKSQPDSVNTTAPAERMNFWVGANASKGKSGVYFGDANGTFDQIAAPTGNVTALESNENGLWVGTERYGLFQIEDFKLKKTFTFENSSGGLRSNTIYAVFTDREGVIWIGTNRGVSRYDPQGPFQENVSDSPNGNFIRALFRASDGRVYAGSNRGVFVKNADEWTQLSAYGNQAIYKIAEDRSKKLVMETEPTQRRSVTAADGAVWIPTEKGVFRMQDGQTEKVIDAEEVRDVYVNGNEVWAATTTRGLVHARHDDRFGWLVSAIGFEQGLPSEKAFAILAGENALMIATNRGVVTYRPGTVAPKLIATRVSSQRVHDLAELRSSIELDYPQNSLVVEVAGQSSRTFPEEFQYAFVVTNAKGEVIEQRVSNDAQFAPADLRSGSYSIEVTAFDRDLNASEPLNIAFTVARAPFPWTAAALGVLLAIAVVALIWAFVERRRIVLRNRELAAARFDLANEAERERSRIARDLHDQTLADLRKLIIMSDKLPPSENAGFRSEIESVSSEIRRICEDLSPSVLENVGLVAALDFLLDSTIENKNFSADELLEEKISFPVNVQLQIYRIAQEVLTNIATHSDATHVEMSVEINDGQFALTIDDDGALFVPEGSAHKGRGIANIRSRGSLINALVEWNESERGGNRFSLTLDA